MLLHLFALLTAAATAVLIFAGGLVTSTGSGLSVPDWPNSYGWFMFTFPVENWVGGIFYEHSHRLIASTVGFLILVLAFWLWRAEPRRVGAQARVHRARRRDHAGHARRHHGAVVPAGSGFDRPRQPGADRVLPHRGHRARHLAGMAPTATPGAVRRPTTGCCSASRVATLAIVYAQIVVGATMRHTDAGLAIPDFPWMFGHLIPDHWDPKIAVHFAHRVGALVRDADDSGDDRARVRAPPPARGAAAAVDRCCWCSSRSR